MLTIVMTIVAVVALAAAFPRYEVLALARGNIGELLTLAVAIVIAATLGAFVGRKKPLSRDRLRNGFWPYLWGGVVGLASGALGIVSTNWSLWFLVPFSFLAAAFIGAAQFGTHAEARHG